MAVVKMLYLTNLSKNTSQMQLSRQIWWESVEGFKRYSTFPILHLQNGSRLHLGFRENFIFDHFVEKYVTDATFLSNMVTIGGTVQKLLHFFLFRRWRLQPSWILSYGHIWVFIDIPFVNSNVVSNSMKIGHVFNSSTSYGQRALHCWCGPFTAGM